MRLAAPFSLLVSALLASTGAGLAAPADFGPTAATAPRPLLLAPLLLAQAAPPASPADIAALIEKAAGGDGRAQMDLGWRYHEGDGVPKDFAKAADLLRKAADQRFALAMVRLGKLFEAGDGLPKDAATAVTWYRKAADAGFAPGQYEVARTYLEGIGIEQNSSLAAGWFRRSADGGLAAGAFAYSKLLQRGEGLPQDMVEAYARLLEAAAFPDAPAGTAAEMDQLRPYLSPEQIARATARAGALPKPKP